LELATRGELKLVERPQPIILGPSDFSNIRASIKVTSTENALIFGNIGENSAVDIILLLRTLCEFNTLWLTLSCFNLSQFMMSVEQLLIEML